MLMLVGTRSLSELACTSGSRPRTERLRRRAEAVRCFSAWAVLCPAEALRPSKDGLSRRGAFDDVSLEGPGFQEERSQ